MYQPFPIYDLRSGMILNRQPWLLPQDAFKNLKNCFLYQGVLQKRKGYSEWGRIVYAVDDEALDTTVDQQLSYSGTLGHYPLRAGDLVISTADSGETFTDQGDGTLDGDNGGSGTINYTTGAWAITYGSNPGGGHAITADYNYFPGNPTMGIENFYTNAGVTQLLAFDTKRVNKYNPSSGKFEDIVGADTWAGGDDNFFWAENWLNKMFVTNNLDRVKKYDGTSFTNLLMDTDDDSINEVDTCLLLLAHKDRLLAFRTSEDGTLCAQRVRWCKAGNPDEWRENQGGGYTDAETVDWIMGAEFIGDDIIVWFERSVWMLKYTATATAPFKWVKITTTEGCYAPHSVVPFSDELLAIGPTSILACDGFTAYNIDEKIPDFLLAANPEKLAYCYGAVAEELRQNLWLYPSVNATHSDSLLTLNYEENSWANHLVDLNVFGYYHFEADLTWDQMATEDTLVDECEFAFDDKEMVAGYPITLGGDYSGYIYQVFYGGTDKGNAIPFEVDCPQWNPYVKQGQKARMGYIDFFVDRDNDISFSVDFYLDHDSAPYQTITVTCDGPVGQEKVWKRVYSGAIGNFHRIRIYHTASNQTPKFHAIVPWFKEAGRMV